MPDGPIWSEVENALFTELAAILREKYKGVTVYPEDVEIPAKFPCVTLVESDQYTYKRTVTADNVKHHLTLTYTVNVYSNQQGNGKQECKDIMQTVADYLEGCGFVMTMNGPVANVDRSISRRTARFTGTLGDNGVVYMP